ncbi:MAG: hypothetical protein QXU67_05665 [Candidatus Bathyarchaeia archaeon]
MERIKIFTRVLQNIKWKQPQLGINRRLACPKCGSKNIELSSKFDAWLMPKKYLCRDCGYIGPIVLEIVEEDKKKEGDE